MSDLHLDSNQFGDFERQVLRQLLKEEGIDHLHIAGDLSNDLTKISLPFLETLKQEIPLSFNLGNHDMLGLSEQEISNYDFQVQQFGRTKLVSFSGWYDYSFVPEKSKRVEESTHARPRHSSQGAPAPALHGGHAPLDHGGHGSDQIGRAHV